MCSVSSGTSLFQCCPVAQLFLQILHDSHKSRCQVVGSVPSSLGRVSPSVGLDEGNAVAGSQKFQGEKEIGSFFSRSATGAQSQNFKKKQTAK